VDPEVYCSLAISCDADPQAVLDRVSCEWGRIGGNRLWVKEISSFTTRTGFGIYFLRNDGDFDTIRAEVTKLLEEAQAMAKAEAGEEYIYGDRAVPHMGI
jgi:hypothetical protein